MPINYIPNDPGAGPSAPPPRKKVQHDSRPAGRATLTLSQPSPLGQFPPGTPGFLFWQCREAALTALDAWESFAGNLSAWQGKRKSLALVQDAGDDLNAFYDRVGFKFFHAPAGAATVFAGASTDVVSHELGHGLLDAIRPDLWGAPFLEVGAFHEAFGDCLAVITALSDPETRQLLLSATKTLKKGNFVETTAEELSAAVRRLDPKHNAAEPRHALNQFQYQIPETLPADGGPGALINEVHSFGMILSGCVYDLLVGLFAAQKTQTPAALLQASKATGQLLVAAAQSAALTPRFFQSVGRAMVLSDETLNGGRNRDLIGQAFAGHGILLGVNAMIAPTAVLAGGKAAGSRAKAVSTAARHDLVRRLGLAKGTTLSIASFPELGAGFSVAQHRQTVTLGALDARLKGVTVQAPVSTLLGFTGGQVAVMGAIHEPVSVEREVHAFVESLLTNEQIEFGEPPTVPARGVVGARRPFRHGRAVARATHRVKTAKGKKVLERIRFHCGRR